MDLNTWLTIVTIFLAIIAFLPNEERHLLQLKLFKFEYWLIFFLLIILIPYLIVFPKIVNRWHFFSKFTFPNGFEASNIAFAIFYLIFIWGIVRLFFMRPKDRINRKIVEYYNNLLLEIAFPKFFSLFIKYSPVSISEKKWELYKEILLNPIFLNEVTLYRPTFLFSFWDRLENENDFKAVLTPFLSNPNSIYYQEIKGNDGISSVLSTSTFLYSVLVSSVKQNLKNGLRFLILEASKSHLRNEKSREHSIYNQPHHYTHVSGEEGYDLPIYYHIRFIDLMYSTAIINKVDVHPHMHTLYASMIGEMINNINIPEGYGEREFPTNYHWLINEIFSIQNHWLETFGGEHLVPSDSATPESDYIYYSSESSYVDFIPSSMGFCTKELFKGLEKGKTTIKFISQTIYYHILSYYLQWNAKDELKSSIESNIISELPIEYLHIILNLALDEAYASNFHSFKDKRFAGSKSEVIAQERLWNFLKGKGKI